MLIVNDVIRRLYDDNKLIEIVKRAEETQKIRMIDCTQFKDKGAQAVRYMSDYPLMTFRVSNADEEAGLINDAVKDYRAVIVQSDTDSITFMALPRLEMTNSGSEYKLECKGGKDILQRFAQEYFDVFNEAFYKLVKDKKLYEGTIRRSSGILTVPFVLRRHNAGGRSCNGACRSF